MRFLEILPVLLALLFFNACDQAPGGLQQRLAEAEAQRDAAIAKVTEIESETKELRKKLDAFTAASGVSSNGSADGIAAVGAAAADLRRTVESSVKPDTITTYREVRYAGFLLKKADGSTKGVAVPFFEDGNGQWLCGWSAEQIASVLKDNPAPVAPSPPPIASTPPAPVTPAPQQSAPPPISSSSAPPGAEIHYTAAGAGETSVPYYIDKNGRTVFILK